MLNPGDASKLSGALQWAGSVFAQVHTWLHAVLLMLFTGQKIFRKLGRAMLRPIITQSLGRSTKVRTDLRLALLWWREVLTLEIRLHHVIQRNSSFVVSIMFGVQGNI